jgi:protein-S-isoprenylcysteine O-methyltransferase Ste14
MLNAMSLAALWIWLYFGWVAAEVAISVGTRTRRSEGEVQDRGSQAILWVVILLAFSVSGWLAARLPPDMPGSALWLKPASLAVLILGLAVRAAAIFTLGKSFSANVATHATQTIQRKGLYRIVRHPSYLGMELIFLAIGMRTENWFSLGVALIPPTLAVLYRIHVEEQALLGAFGEEYRNYSQTTRRLIPGVY